MKKSLLFCLLFFSLNTYTQDPIFTQFHNVPEYLNPSFTGAGEGSQIGIINRSQWFGLNYGLNSQFFYFDGYIDNINSGLGISILNHHESITKYNFTQVNFNYSYQVQLSDGWFFYPSVSAGFGIKDFAFDNLLLEDQILISQGIINTIENVIATGKEGNVFRAKTIKGENRAVKIYRINTATFRKLEKYIEGDSRFKNSGNSPRDRIFTWAQKEYKNLHSMRAAGANVPQPYHVHKNIVVMQYLGWRFRPYPTVRELPPDEPEDFFEKLKLSVKAYRNHNLSHGDLSEYNIINRRGEPFIIDVGQAVPDSHPLYNQLHRRDMKNLHRFWKKYIPSLRKEDLKI